VPNFYLKSFLCGHYIVSVNISSGKNKDFIRLSSIDLFEAENGNLPKPDSNLNKNVIVHKVLSTCRVLLDKSPS